MTRETLSARARVGMWVFVQLGLTAGNVLHYFLARTCSDGYTGWAFMVACSLQVLHGSLGLNGLRTFEGAAKLVVAVGAVVPWARRAPAALEAATDRREPPPGPVGAPLSPPPVLPVEDDAPVGYDEAGNMFPASPTAPRTS